MAPATLERYTESASNVVEAMTAFPYYVGGAWTMTTPLIDAFGGELLAKEGAEGFYAIGIAPEMAATLTKRLAVADDTAIAIALKIHDGSMTRGRNPVILRTLELLGVEVPLPREWPIVNVVGTHVGDVRAEFELNFL